MAPMPSGLSGNTCCSDNSAKHASHITTFEMRSEREYSFQFWLSLASTPETFSTSFSMGRNTSSSHVRWPLKTRAMYSPIGTLVAMVNRMVTTTAVSSVAMVGSEFFRPQHRVHEIHGRGNAQEQ